MARRVAGQAHGSGTKAPFTKVGLAVDGTSHGFSATWRGIVKAIWYRGNGTVLGYVTHTVQWYGWKLGTSNVLVIQQDNCPNFEQKF